MGMVKGRLGGRLLQAENRVGMVGTR
jgi:hypothetical protein